MQNAGVNVIRNQPKQTDTLRGGKKERKVSRA